MSNWEKFNETSLPEKEDSYGHLSREDITDADYAHAERKVYSNRYIIVTLCISDI